MRCSRFLRSVDINEKDILYKYRSFEVLTKIENMKKRKKDKVA